MKTHNGHLRYLHIIGCIACCLAYFFSMSAYASQPSLAKWVIPSYKNQYFDTPEKACLHHFSVIYKDGTIDTFNRAEKISYNRYNCIVNQNFSHKPESNESSIGNVLAFCSTKTIEINGQAYCEPNKNETTPTPTPEPNQCPEKGTPYITDGPTTSYNMTSDEVYVTNARFAATFCHNNCTILLPVDQCRHNDMNNPESKVGFCHYKERGQHMGTSCVAEDGLPPAPPDMNPPPQPDGTTPTPKPLPPPPEKPICKKGTCPGNVNGTDVCVPCTSTSKNETKKTTTEKDTIGDGKKDTKVEKEVTTNTVKNKDGTTTTITTTTTTTTKTNPDGTQTTETKKETEVENTGNDKFCSENPQSPLCEKKEDSFFHGSGCDSEPTCKGDAIQCAMVKYHHQQNCILTAQTEESQIYGNSKDEKDENLLSSNPENETLQITLQQVTASQPNRLPYGSCPNSLNLTVSSTPFSFDISQICPYLEHMGNLLIAFALFASAFLLSRDF